MTAMVEWVDGYGNRHRTPVLATFPHKANWYVVTEHPRNQFAPIILIVTLFDKEIVEAESF